MIEAEMKASSPHLIASDVSSVRSNLVHVVQALVDETQNSDLGQLFEAEVLAGVVRSGGMSVGLVVDPDLHAW